MPISARFIANKASYKFKYAQLTELLNKDEGGPCKMIRLYDFTRYAPRKFLNRDIARRGRRGGHRRCDYCGRPRPQATPP